MLNFALLTSVALAHTQLFIPAPKFLSPSENNFPSECNQITFHNDAPAVNIDAFTSQLKSKFGGSLLAYFKACGSDSPKTDHNGQAPIPADGMVKIDSHAQHPGLYEFYIDDTKVAGGTWQVGQTPDTLPIDFSKCAGTCKFRYMMAAVHQQPIQLYDNIVTLTGSPSNGASSTSPSSSGNAPNSSNSDTDSADSSSNGASNSRTSSSDNSSDYDSSSNGASSNAPSSPARVPSSSDNSSDYDTSSTGESPNAPNSSDGAAESADHPTESTPEDSNSNPIAKNYEQCGGSNFNGASQCASGLTCVKQNDYYSQCLAGSGYRRR